MDILVVVDMQNDFISGSLGTRQAKAIVPRVIEKLHRFSGHVFFTRDTHAENYLSTQEGRLLPVMHCISGTDGHRLHPEIEPFCTQPPIDKPTFGSTELGKALAELSGREKIDSITLIGLCTDICVISNAMIAKAFLPEVPVTVDAACCAGVTPESHRNALSAMKMCQVRIENE